MVANLTNKENMEDCENVSELRQHIAVLEERVASQKEAVDVALRASEKRFDSVNEFRQTLTDQAKTFMTLKEAEAKFEALGDKIDNIHESLSLIIGQKSGAATLWGWMAAAIGIVFGLIALFMKGKQ